MTEMVRTLVNGRWELLLPDHRAKRPEWETGWERERLDSMCLNIRPGDIVFDIGSEEADLTALYVTWGARVVMFEPNARVWPNARAIWEANDLPLPLAVVEAFAAETDRDAHWGTAWPDSAYGEVIGAHGFESLHDESDIARIRIDTFVEESGEVPHVITIDVEGAELEVLRGATETLERHHPLVYCSIHDDELREHYQATSADLLGHMRDLGYFARHLATDHEAHYLFHHPEGREVR